MLSHEQTSCASSGFREVSGRRWDKSKNAYPYIKHEHRSCQWHGHHFMMIFRGTSKEEEKEKTKIEGVLL